MLEKETYRAYVAGQVVDLLQLWEDDDGLAFSLEALPEGRVADDGGRQGAAEAAGDEKFSGGLDRVLGRLVQRGGLLTAAEGEGCVADCGRSCSVMDTGR